MLQSRQTGQAGLRFKQLLWRQATGLLIVIKKIIVVFLFCLISVQVFAKYLKQIKSIMKSKQENYNKR